jgi:pyruvate-formate lyase-activating enzyme
MNCAEFQRVLPFIIETGGDAEQEEHLRSCPVCGDLVADLKYIAEAAKLLVPMEDPPASVWDGIQRSLEREGVARPAGPRGRLLKSVSVTGGWES